MRSWKVKGYKARDSGTHRQYNFKGSVRRFKRTGRWTYRGHPPGLGHAAGRRWGEAKHIDPYSSIQIYSNNSPSFDEGVYNYKQSAKSKALNK